MALKDWKKYWESKDKDWISYRNKRSRTVEIIKNKVSNYWTFSIERSLTGAKIFKTKQKALNYAKWYMSMH